MKRVTDRKRRDFVSRFLKCFHRLFNSLTRTTDHGLVFAVDIGDDHISVHRFENALDLLERGEYSSHAAVVLHCEFCHLAATRTHRLQRVRKGQSRGRNQCPVLSQAVPHGEVGSDSIRREQAG